MTWSTAITYGVVDHGIAESERVLATELDHDAVLEDGGLEDAFGPDVDLCVGTRGRDGDHALHLGQDTVVWQDVWRSELGISKGKVSMLKILHSPVYEAHPFYSGTYLKRRIWLIHGNRKVKPLKTAKTCGMQSLQCLGTADMHRFNISITLLCALNMLF